MANMANVISAALRANEHQLCPASTSPPGASSDPTIPEPSHHMAATPSMVSSATFTDEMRSFLNDKFEVVTKAADYFRVTESPLQRAYKNSEYLEALTAKAKQLVGTKSLLASWVNDVSKAAIDLEDIVDQMVTEMSRLQAEGHKFYSEEIRSVRRKLLLKIKKLSEDQEDLIKRASIYGLGTNNGDMLQCGTCKSLQPHHSIKAVPTYACY